MTLRDWFIAPAPPEPSEETAEDRAPPSASATTWAPPANAAPRRVSAPGDVASSSGRVAAPGNASPVDVASPAHYVPPALTSHDDLASPGHVATLSVASAAVIGRPGEAEPVAAGVALALRARAPAAAVIVVGERAVSSGDGGTRAARRLAARLEAHGFDAGACGRLAWAYVTPEAAGRAARVAGEPVALAITVPLGSALELTIAEQDLAIVVARDEQGPLAQLAAASLTCRTVITTKPLPRGLPRLLARHGMRAPGAVRAFIPAHQLSHS